MKMETITKEGLLKSDPALKNRPYQIEALLSIFLYAKCLVKMFCGTGKSRIITNVIIHEKKELSVVVFPSLALISQYSADYLNNAEYAHHFKKYQKKNVSSEKLEKVQASETLNVSTAVVLYTGIWIRMVYCTFGSTGMLFFVNCYAIF